MQPEEFRSASHAVWEAMAPGWEERHGWLESARPVTERMLEACECAPARRSSPPPEPGQPGILALADTARLRRLFADAGLTEPEIDEVPFAFTFTDEDDYWRFLFDVAGAISMVLKRLDDEARAAIRVELSTRLEPYRVPDGLELPAVSLVAAAARR